MGRVLGNSTHTGRPERANSEPSLGRAQQQASPGLLSLIPGPPSWGPTGHQGDGESGTGAHTLTCYAGLFFTLKQVSEAAEADPGKVTELGGVRGEGQ